MSTPTRRSDPTAEPVDESGDETCGRTTDATAGVAAEDVPIACTLGAGEMATRLDEWNALLDDEADPLRGVTARQGLDDGGLRLEFGPSADVTEIARLAAAEQGCCRFFTFALVIDDRGVALEVHAPADGRPVLTELFGAAD